MLEFEQQFIDGCICPICSMVQGKYGGTTIQERKFVTNSQDPSRCCCSKCSYSTLTKDIQKIKQKETGGQS